MRDGEVASSRRAELLTLLEDLGPEGLLPPPKPVKEKWLEEKGAEEGVVTLNSGLRYKVLKSGKAWAKSPMAHTKCTCKYKGTLTPANGGKQFDAGEIDFAPNQVIAGWTEAMQLMREGDEWELYIPSALGYGETGAGADIPGGAALVFTMEIKKVHGKKTGKDFKRFEPIPEEHRKKKKSDATVETAQKAEL